MLKREFVIAGFMPAIHFSPRAMLPNGCPRPACAKPELRFAEGRQARA
jgi:hypothetical protein